MTLRVLEEGVCTRLQSGVAITTMAQCVEKLVENCIDAGATCVAVRIDLSRYKIQVVDNGRGISNDDLKLVGERYTTSKCHTLEDLENLEYFGYRGEALASIIDVSRTVEMCSRHALSRQTYSKVFHNGKSVGVSLSRNHRSSVGTTVTVHDFFYNLPIRRRGISDVLELEKVRKVVEGIALVNPKISLSVRNDKVGECVLQTHKSQSVLNSFGRIFGSEKALAMKEVSVVNSCFKISGFMSTEGHYNKALQFIYINRRVVKNSLLHGYVNSLLANSMIAKKLSRQSETRGQSKESSSGTDFLSPKRTPEKYGMFVLMIECPRNVYDICLDPAKTLVEFKQWDIVLSALECLVKKFLVDNNLALGPVAFGTNNPNNGSTEIVVESDSHSGRQPSLNAVPPASTSKFSGERVTYDIEFPGAVQSQTVRQQNATRHMRSQQATFPTMSSQSSEPKIAEFTPLQVTSVHSRHLLPLPGYNSDSICVDDSCTVGCDRLALQSVPHFQSMNPDTGLHVGSSCCEIEDVRTLQLYPLQCCNLSYSANDRENALGTDEFDRHCTHTFQSDTATRCSVSHPTSLAHQSIHVPETQIPCSQSQLQQVLRSAFGHEPVLASHPDTDDHVNSVSCKAPVSTSIARSSLGVVAHNVGREFTSKPLLGLNTPLRSPLQSSNLSSKLAKLIHKGKSAQISQQKFHKNTSARMSMEKCEVPPLTKALITPRKPLCECTHVCACTTQSSIVHSCSGKPANTTAETFNSAHQLLPLGISHLHGTSQRILDFLPPQTINSRSSVSCLPGGDGDLVLSTKDCAKFSNRDEWLHGLNRSYEHHQSYLCHENLTESVSYTQTFVPNTFVRSQLHVPLQPSRQEGSPWNHPPTNSTVLVTTSVPHLETEIHSSALAAEVDTAADTEPSVGCDISSHTNVVDGSSAVYSSGMHLSDRGSATFPHPPTPHVDHPMSHVDHPLSHVDHPMSHVIHPMLCVYQPRSHVHWPISHVDHLTSSVHQPVTHVQPQAHVDQPVSHIDQPMSHVDQPTSHVDQPMSHVDQCVSYVDHPTTHVDQPVSCVDHPTTRVGPPMSFVGQHMIQPSSHADYSMSHVDQPLAYRQNSDFNEHRHRFRLDAIPVENFEHLNPRRCSLDNQQPKLTQLRVYPPNKSYYSYNQQSQLGDSFNVHSNSSSSSTTDDMGAEDQHSIGSSPKWKEIMNPATGETLYIHSSTGKCVTQKPANFMETSTLCVTSESIYQQVGYDTYIPDNCDSCSGDEVHPNPSTLKAEPLRAAPHLSHNFSAFLPRPKHQRVLSTSLYSKPSSSDTGNTVNSSGSSILSVVADTKRYGSENGSKWRHECELEQLERTKGSWDDLHSVAGMLEGWENLAFQAGHEDILNIGYSGCERGQIRVHSVINNYKFSREMFQNVKVLGQVDSKFIACLMDKNSCGRHNLLVVIDQHAAHERVRLEALTSDLWEEGIPFPGNSATLAALPPPIEPRIKSSLVQPPIVISLQASERRLAKLFRKQLETIGVFLTFRGGAVLVSSVPSVLVQREASEVKRGRPTVALDILQEMIVKRLELLQTTSGGCSILPSAISNVLNSQACHGAIKFGDSLTLEECEALVQSLKQCKLPFQCAHGRPALMPILDLDILLRRYPTQEMKLPDLKKLTNEI